MWTFEQCGSFYQLPQGMSLQVCTSHLATLTPELLVNFGAPKVINRQSARGAEQWLVARMRAIGRIGFRPLRRPWPSIW
jgi:hypothetical protein